MCLRCVGGLVAHTVLLVLVVLCSVSEAQHSVPLRTSNDLYEDPCKAGELCS